MMASNLHMPLNTESSGQCVSSIVINGLMVQVKVVTQFIFLSFYILSCFRLPL